MAEQKWVTLQKKIFGRWIKNKLKPEGVKFDDVLKDMNGYSLATLCATLAEVDKISKKKCPKDKKCKMRVAKIDSAVNALKFMYKLGVKQKIKTSAENIVDGEEKPILGMVWAIMTKFMVIGDESAGQDLKTSLLQWVQNTVKNHKVKVKNFGKHFHDGRVLAAIIHKHRPALIDFESLSPETPEENLEKVFDAAEKYFGLEKYLTPQDIFELREKSMIVYVSEFYYGIAAQRTLDLAAKRIHKLINYTKINDQMKNEYNEKAAALKDRILKVEKVLHDREVDNTLQGAKDKLAAFYTFQKEDKAALIGTLLDIERLFGAIALRLADHGRPAFVPKEGLGLDGLRDTVKVLEKAEKDRNQALHAELNRQLTLLQLQKFHKTLSDVNKNWQAATKEYLDSDPDLKTSAQAEFEMNVCDGCVGEVKEVQAENMPSIVGLGDKMEAQHFEKMDEVRSLEKELSDGIDTLLSAAKDKTKRLKGEFDRLKHKEGIELAFGNRAKVFANFVGRTIQDVKTSAFGMTLEEVREYGEKLGAKDEKTRKSVRSQFAKLQEIHESGTEAGYDPSGYTSETIESLKNNFDAVEAAITDRRNAYDAELAKQIKHDELCKTFADLAEAFSAKITEKKDQITNLQSELESQLETIQEEEKVDYSSELDAVATADKAVKAENISHNRHTLLKNDQIVALHADLQKFLGTKGQMIKDEIQHKKLRGLTQEQHDDIEKQFKQFDKDNSGALSPAEFKVVLYSLGFERSKKEIQALADTYGDGKDIPYEGFKEFMIKELGDNESEEEINKGFGLLTNFEETLSAEKETFFSPEDWKWFTNSCPKKGDGYQYKKWVKDMYSR